MVWGERYLDDFLAMALPALLAPGNLPVLADHFTCELVIVTEEAFFGRIESNATFQNARKYCDARLVLCDDLIVSRNMYGHSLTHALHRGFADLGDRMTETFLLFFNADFVLADDSYRSLVEHMRNGERLIFAPSYCAVSERIAPILRGKMDPDSAAIAIPSREMAEIILAHKHNTIRTKIVNQQIFHINVPDQFYWFVDEHTLLGRQMPVAIVCMKPERVYTDPVSFWDYATVTMACPTLSRTVLGDSDDFLMVELRARDSMMDLMRIGRISQQETARVLGGYMTADQIEMGHYPLVLHARDCPPGCQDAREKLGHYVDGVYAALPAEKISHIDHPYWSGLIEQFRTNRAEWRQVREAASGPVEGHADTTSPTRLVRGGTREQPPRSFVHRAYQAFVGSLPEVTPFHPYWANLVHVRRLVREGLSRNREDSPAKVLLVKDEAVECFVTRAVEEADCQYASISSYGLRQQRLNPAIGDFDFCLCELGWAEINQLVALHGVIRRHMRPGARIVFFHASEILKTLTPENVRGVLAFLPSDAMTRIYFSGSPGIGAAIGSYRSALDKRARSGGQVGFALHVLINLIRSWRANREAVTRPWYEGRDNCTAITIEIEVNG